MDLTKEISFPARGPDLLVRLLDKCLRTDLLASPLLTVHRLCHVLHRSSSHRWVLEHLLAVVTIIGPSIDTRSLPTPYVATASVRITDSKQGLTNAVFGVKRKLAGRIPVELCIVRHELEIPFSKDAASGDIILQTIAIVAQRGHWKILAADLEVVKEDFGGHIAANFMDLFTQWVYGIHPAITSSQCPSNLKLCGLL